MVSSLIVFSFFKGGLHKLRPPLFCQYVVSSNIWFLAVALYTNSAMAFNRVLSLYPNNKVCNYLRGYKFVIGGMVVLWASIFTAVWGTLYVILEDPISSPSCWMQAAQTRTDSLLSLARGDTVDVDLVIGTSLALAMPSLSICFFCYGIIIWRLLLRGGGGSSDQRRKENCVFPIPFLLDAGYHHIMR